jgi:hypothetical protein
MHAAFVKSGDPSTASRGEVLARLLQLLCYLPLYVFCGRHLLGCAIRRWDHRALGVPTVPHGRLDKIIPAWACIEGVLMAKLAALAAALLLYSPAALDWGGLGHEAICELAFRELDDTARQRVIALIRQDQEFTSFRASCNWADRPRTVRPSTSDRLVQRRAAEGR